MCDGSEIVLQRQHDVRNEIDRRGFALKVVASKAGIPYNTFCSYFPADENARPTQIPGGAIFSLIAGRALPLDIISLLMPEGVQIVRADEDIDHDWIEDLCREYLASKASAHHKDSPAGREISDCENADLSAKAAGLRAVRAA